MTTGLVWNSPIHWDHRGPKPCRHCGGPTQLRDDDRLPSHKVCAEQALNPPRKDSA